jgi:hypothetical protein
MIDPPLSWADAWLARIPKIARLPNIRNKKSNIWVKKRERFEE